MTDLLSHDSTVEPDKTKEDLLMIRTRISLQLLAVPPEAEDSPGELGEVKHVLGQGANALLHRYEPKIIYS
jgi:hypothetical protein